MIYNKILFKMYKKFTKSTVTYKALLCDDSVTLFTCSCS